MTLEELMARVEQRLASIRNNKDQGVYAKFYEEDVAALSSEVEELRAEVGRLRNSEHTAYKLLGGCACVPRT